ncbi:hypothetical protein [Bacterioplanoides sp.]|uniref:hypothetical protein n=1 Tax=Bacterioplanoides sp. TaxID=2066072 RepID=UPI003B00607C
MKSTDQFRQLFICAASSLLIVACGGSGGGGGDGGPSNGSGISFTGNTAPAQIDESNAQSIGETSGEAVRQAAGTSSLPTAVEVQEVDLEPVHRTVIESAQLSTLPSGVDVSSGVCTGGGSANVTFSGPGQNGSGRLDSTIVYDNCVFNSGNTTFTIDGTVITEDSDVSNPSSAFSISYQNVTVSGLGFGSQTLNYTFSCTNASVSSTCTQSSTFVSSSGGTHQISDYSISGNTSSGFNGTASFSHATYGTVSINVSGLTYGSCGTSPDGGTIAFTSSNGSSGSITFSSNCTVSGTWNTGSASGSF